ncbi:MAG: lamin tail domain-containing protein [Candidatus Latescibacterota bacterium]
MGLIPRKKEFVELHNTRSTLISLAGWRFTDDDRDTVLAPDSYVLLFSGGTPSNFAVPVFVDDRRIGNGLTISGDRLLLFDSAADTVLDYSFASESSLNQSLNRHEERYQLHKLLPGWSLFSSGQAPTEYTSFAIVDPKLNEGQTRDLMITGRYPTGSDTLDATKLQWLSVEPHVAQILSRSLIKGLQPGQTLVECWRDALFLAQKRIGVTTPEPPNDLPRITSKPDTAAFANEYYRYRVQATDTEQNTTVFTFAQAPAWLDCDGQSGLIESHTPDTTGIFTVAFEAADGRGGHVAQSFRLDL